MNTYKLFFPVMLLALIITSCSSSLTENGTGRKNWGFKDNVKKSTTYSAVQKFGKYTKEKPTLRIEFTNTGELSIIESVGNYTNFFKYEGNKLIGTENYNGDGILTKKDINKFEGDKVVEVCEYDANDILTGRIKKNYEGDKLVEEITYESDNSIRAKSQCKYHKNGRYKSQETNYFKKDGSLDFKFYLYNDENGNLLEIGNERGVLSRWEYKYDFKGNLVESKEFHEDGTFDKYIYTNDEHGNWIEKIPAEGSSSTAIGEIREIEYY